MRGLYFSAFVLLILLLLSYSCVAQETRLLTDIDTTGLTKTQEAEEPPTTITFQCFPVTSTQPEYQGGKAALQTFIREQLRYPPALLRANVEGWTDVQFLVDTRGRISQLAISHSLCQPWDEEVLRVARLLDGQFKPATYNGHPAACMYSMRVHFFIK